MGVFCHLPPSKPRDPRPWHLGSSQLGGQQCLVGPSAHQQGPGGCTPSPRANTGGFTAGPAGPGCPGRPQQPRPGWTRRVRRPCLAEPASALGLPSVCIVLATVSQQVVSPVSIPAVCEPDLAWEWGFCRCNKVKRWPHGSGRQSRGWCLHKVGSLDTDTQREGPQEKRRQKLGDSVSVKMTARPPEQEESGPSLSSGSPALPSPWFWTPD